MKKGIFCLVSIIFIMISLTACLGDFQYYKVGEFDSEDGINAIDNQTQTDISNNDSNSQSSNYIDTENGLINEKTIKPAGFLDITVTRVNADDFSDGRVFQTIEYPDLSCADNNYIDTQLKKLTNEYKDEVIKFRDESKDTIRDMIFNDTSEGHYFQDLEYLYTIEAEVVTNDENYLSILKKTNTYTGGAHPSYFINGVTFDIKNNKQTDLYDFVKDKETLRTFLKNYVSKNKDILYEDADKTVDRYIDNPPNEFNIDYKIDYYIQNHELHIVFQAYELAPYAAGIIDIIADKDILKVDI